MAQPIDYSTYTLAELHSAAGTINRTLYPERGAEIDALIQERIANGEAANRSAGSVLSNEPGSLATRFDRFLAFLVDIICMLIAITPVFMFVGLEEFESLSLFSHVLMTVYGFACYAALHGYLLYTNGQTLGKRLLGIRIETLDGEKVSLKRYIFLRSAPVYLINYIPLIGSLLGFVGYLLIFGPHRRCLHDYIARTKVSYT